MLHREKVADLLDDIAMLLELKGENPFKIRAYQMAAAAVKNMDQDIEAVIDAGRLEDVKGIGKAIAANIIEYVKSGRSSYHEEMKASIPSVIFELVAIPGLGPKKAFILQERLGIDSVGELEYACRENRLVGLPGFGEKTQQKILQGIEYVKKFKGQFLLVDTWPVAAKIAEYLQAHEAVQVAEVAGSIRRRKEIVKDIDITAAALDREAAAEAVVSMPGVTEVTAKGSTKVSVTLSTGTKLDVRIVETAEYASTLHHFTGSQQHHIQLRGLAKEKGYVLSEYGLETSEGKRLQPQSEQELYQILGLPYIEPELREGLGEIEAAAAGRLPRLVAEQDLRGVFHVHTHYSDGSDTLQDMAAAAKARGWQYLGIADHSQTAVYAKGLKPDRVREQQRIIDAMNSADPAFRILSGIESDILPDGSLDYPDEILAGFDFVVASVHSAFRQSEADMTRRIIKALNNKYVTMLGHATGRILLAREGYAVDLPAILRSAAETGTVLEINASPYRLDLDWRWHRQAKELGAMFAINPDAHAVDELDYVKYGTAMARKGWLGAGDIINTRNAQEVIQLLNRKRK